jgi:hypothetical protein
MEIKVLCRGSEAGHGASDLFYSLQEKKCRSKKHKIMELEGFGSRKRTIYFANTCVSQYCVFG